MSAVQNQVTGRIGGRLRTGVGLVVAAALAAPAALAAAAPVQVEWAAAQTLSVAGNSANNPLLVTSRDGRRLAAVWRRSDGAHDRIQLARSADGGGSWTVPTNLSDAGQTAEAHSIAMSADGMRIVVVWSRSDGTRMRVQAVTSTDGGSQWSPAATLSDPGQDAITPQVALSRDGSRVVAVWSRSDGTTNRVQTRASGNGGVDWGPVRDVSAAGSSGTYPEVALAGDGSRAVALWRRYDGTKLRVAAAWSADGGGIWPSQQDLSAGGQDALDARVAISHDGLRVAAVWQRNDGTHDVAQYAGSPDGGQSWSPVRDLSAAGGGAERPRIAMSDDGARIAAVWTRYDGSADLVQARVSDTGGADWSAPRDLSAPGQNASYPHVALSTDGIRLTGTWIRSDGANGLVQARSSTDFGETWSDPRTLSAAGQSATEPQAAVSADGTRLAAAWSRFDGTWDAVQAAVGTAATLPGPPRAVAADPGDGLAAVSWTPPLDDGGSPVTGYTASAAPGGRSCTAVAAGCTISGLDNGTAYSVTVVAANAVGAGPPSEPVTVVPAAPTAVPAPPRTTVVAKARAGRSKLRVRIKPDLGPRKQWRFVVKKKSGAWRAVKRGGVKVFKTRGPKHVRLLNLPKGRYKVRSRAARGYAADTSAVVRLRR